MDRSPIVLEAVKKYIAEISHSERGSILRDIDALCSNEAKNVHTRQLRGKIRELKVGPHRITYFELGGILYFVNGFRKKSKKAPKREIEYAEHVYKLMRTYENQKAESKDAD